MELSQSRFQNKRWKQHGRQALRSKKYMQGCVWSGGLEGNLAADWRPLVPFTSGCCYCFYQDIFLPQMQKLELWSPSTSGPSYRQTLGCAMARVQQPSSLWEHCQRQPAGSGGCLLGGATPGVAAIWHRLVTLIETWGGRKCEVGFQASYQSLTGKTFLLKDFPKSVFPKAGPAHKVSGP